LDSTTALETVKADSRLAAGLRRIKMPTTGGEQVQQCLRSDEYAWWLALIDPHRFKSERRAVLQKRQRILMGLAKEIMLKRQQLRTVTSKPARVAPQVTQATAVMSGPLEGTFHCLRCGAPHLLVIDGAGWHLHLGVEVE
jgi:hypothetical protein